ncbi:hypothetical protein CANARDRAFT_26838 [[Candida] arabinofermentans NRRL YB-2248]|uniref:Calcineurin-like phosphoesterase domain-containing protein n=1 Tax=[Candida] arabinofermentans NRRL YB-2248 TaxID=983967 RepID=A0A1E4T6Q5_9ASCO|nr:hypothetical protein CANARDRAFT_26838 [[Candida] arabinofermentans NRRL YB-2248]
MLGVKASLFRRILSLKPIVPAIIIWFQLFIFFQVFLPYIKASNCNFDTQQENPYNILLIADPQLIDNHTYPDRGPLGLAISQFTVDNYIRTNFGFLMRRLKPDTVIFLGDLQDNARDSNDEYFQDGSKRFNTIFPLEKYESEVIYSIPGNHDIGWANGVQYDRLTRFEEAYGKTNTMLTRNNHELIFLDTISLSNTEDERVGKSSREFLEELSKKPKQSTRIMFHHVPLARDPKIQTCGPKRESSNPFPLSKGYQYQTIIDGQISKQVLEKVKPDLIFSGDDHDYCEVIHHYGDDHKQAIEVNVKSISMAMGIWKPAVELLTLYDHGGDSISVNGEIVKSPTFAYSMCYLPTPYQDIIFYVIFAVINGLYLIWICYNRTSKYVGFMEAEIEGNRITDHLSKIDCLLLMKYVIFECLAISVIYFLLL